MTDHTSVEDVAAEAARRNGVSADAARCVLDGLAAGGGTMAQFSHPDLGGTGQWSAGGMLMIGDMFNGALKAKVAALCEDLASTVRSRPDLARPAASRHGAAEWWPSDLGLPSSTGAQNDVRYAVFPKRRRLAIEEGGRVSVYDTGDHVIGGVSQQQGGGTGAHAFSSQNGTVRLDGLRRISAGAQPDRAEPHASRPPPRSDDRHGHASTPPSGPAATAGTSPGHHLDTLERLADLHKRGILTDAEFSAKKSELLDRI